MPKAKQKSNKKAAKKAAKTAAKQQKKAAKKAAKAKLSTAAKASETKAKKPAKTKSANKKAGKKPAKTKSASKKSATKKSNKKSASKKSATKKPANKKSTGKSAGKKSTGKSAGKKPAIKKSATKKSAATKPATKKSATKKSGASKAPKAARPRPAAGPAGPELIAVRRFYALPVDSEAHVASDENLTDQSEADLVVAHLSRNYGYFGAIDKTLSGFFILDDEGDNYYLADLRDSGQVWWQDHETRDVSLAFASVADFAAYKAARDEARDSDDDDEDEDDDEIAARFRPRKLKSTSELRPTTADLLARYQWLVWLFARSHELRGKIIDKDDEMVRRAFGHLRHVFASTAAENKAFERERGRLADDPHLGIYWLLHTSVLADNARRDEVVAALAGSEEPLVHAFVAAFGALAPDGDIPVAPGFRARRSQMLFFSGGALTGETVDIERLLAALVADPVGIGFVKAHRLVEIAAETGALDRLQQFVAAGPPGVELGFQALAALLDARAGRETSLAADAVLQNMLESADVDLLAGVIESLHVQVSDRERLRALIDAVLARDPYHWGMLQVGKDAAERDGDAARVEQLTARIAPLAEVRPVMLQIFADDDDERERGIEKFRELEPAQRLLLARRLLVMASQIAAEALAAAVEVLLAAGDTEGLADLEAAAVGLADPSDFAKQLGELREDGFVDLADPLLPTVKALLLRPESGEFMADDWKEDLVEKLAPIAHEPAVFDWLLAALAEDSRHELRDNILSKLFIAYSDNQVVARLSEEQADRLVRLAAKLGVKPGKSGDDDDDDDVFPAIHVYHAAGRILFYFTNPGALAAITELLATVTDKELLGKLYNALGHIKTPAALQLVRSRLFLEQRQTWNLCNTVAETWDEAAHADIMAELERTRSDHAANSYAVVFLDFESDIKKKPHAYVAAIARAVLGWPEPADARARGQRKFVLMHAVRLGLESGDHELVRQAHAAALAIAEPPFSNLKELHYESATDDPWQSLKAKERKQLDKVLSGEAATAQPRRAAKPLKKISDDALAELAGVPVDRRFLTTPEGEVWFFDKQDRLLVFDGLEVGAPRFTFVPDIDDLAVFLAGAERCDGHVVHWDGAAYEFRDIVRYGDRVLVFEGINNGRFATRGFVADSPEAAAALYAKIADHPLKDWSVAGAWYVPQRGGMSRDYYAPRPAGVDDERDTVRELRDDPEALAQVEDRVLALLKRPGSRVACIEWMERLRRPADMGLLEYFKDRAREDSESPAWHLQAFAEFERLLAEWGWTPALAGLSVSRGAPPDEAALARFAAAAGAEVPPPLLNAWTEGPLAWRLGERGRTFLGPDEALARGPALAAAIEAIAARLPTPRAEAVRALMAGAQVVLEDEQQRPEVLFVPNSPSRAEGRVFTRFGDLGPKSSPWFESAFEWFIAEELGRPFVAALVEACPDLLGLPYGARRHPDVVRRRYHQDGKFWEATFDPEAAFVLTRYGKIGAAGSEKLRRFPGEAEARASFEKLVKEKTGEGYRPAK